MSDDTPPVPPPATPPGPPVPARGPIIPPRVVTRLSEPEGPVRPSFAAPPPAPQAAAAQPPAPQPPAPPLSYDEQIASSALAAQADDRNPGRNPGKTLGIIGLVLAIPVAVAGLIFSILGVRKSKRAGRGNALAWAGIVLSTLVILGGIAGGVYVATVLQPVFALQQACAAAGPGEYTDQNGNPVTCP